ncbi:hypothetical protein NPIL_247101 [Nephila pilipes]|uniref:Uncharacterized protein n=1 Tax=Nephila pilipes TaxID=299642 RepID=A0A8X6PJB6_NEPPI|nr:hypothetical protein NPIL_247101 [Nephila pilipes]
MALPLWLATHRHTAAATAKARALLASAFLQSRACYHCSASLPLFTPFSNRALHGNFAKAKGCCAICGSQGTNGVLHKRIAVIRSRKRHAMPRKLLQTILFI